MFLIDAHGLIFQVFHAISEMNSPTGLPVNALFGFARDVLTVRSKKPDYLVCAFDRPEPTFRSQIYPDYKANRPPMADNLRVQIPLIYQLLEALRIPVLAVPGFEADDLMATVAQAAAQRGLDVYICSSDKDCRQLISDRIRLYSLRKRSEFGRAELLQEWGITPEQVIDFQALVGDSVDNVPGVPGIGEKTASALLREFGTLDAILSHIDRVPGAKRQANLRAWAAQDAVSRQLVRLETQVPLAMDWEDWRLKPWDHQKLISLFQEWGFRYLSSLVRPESPEPIFSCPGHTPVQGELFEGMRD